VKVRFPFSYAKFPGMGMASQNNPFPWENRNLFQGCMLFAGQPIHFESIVNE